MVKCIYSKTYANPSTVIQQDSGNIKQMIDRCSSNNIDYTNTSETSSCIFNSNSSGYDYDKYTSTNVCIYDPCMINDKENKCILSTDECKTLVPKWLNKGPKIYNYKGKEVKLGIGHGILNNGRGQCAMLEYNNKYAIILQVDIRAWSLEITEETMNYLINTNDPGGKCFIPNVKQIDCNDVLDNITP